MKKLIVVLSFSLLGLIACKDESSSEAALTPQDQCIAQGGMGCQTQYGGASFYGNYAYPQSNGYYHGYVGGGVYNAMSCPPNTQPVGNPVFGLGCIPNNQMPNIPYTRFNIMVGGNQMGLPTSCISGAHCVTGRCVQSRPDMVGICSRY